MKTYAWKDLKHKSSPERRAQIDREALVELDRMGFAALRKARQQTQVELAETLGINQASVSVIENNSDLLLSTLAKYVRALGGEVEIRAVFPEATFNLGPIPVVEGKRGGKPADPRKRAGAGARSAAGRKARATA
jgi:DNA-binding XRE family transcriptional regulator